MKSKDNELWWQLCELAASEEDPEKVIAIAKAINHLLDEQADRPRKSKTRSWNVAA